MSAATASSRPSPAPSIDRLDIDAGDTDFDRTPEAREHRLSGRWAAVDDSAWPKFTKWRCELRLTRRSLASRLVAVGFRPDAEDLIRRIEAGQSPTIAFLGAVAKACDLTRDQVLAMFTVNGNPIL